MSFIEHYTENYGRYLREQRLAGSLPLTMFEMLQPAGDFSDPPVSDLVVIDTRTSMRGSWDFGAGRIHSAEAGLIYVVPAYCATDIVIDHPHMFRAFSLPATQARTRIQECFGGTLPDFSKLQHLGTRDPLIANLLSRLWASGADDAALGRLFADSAVLTLLAELVREAGQPMKLAKGGLSPRQLRLAKDFVEAGLDRDISLDQVAGAAGLTPFHFARAFKQTTGMTPFQYVAKRRVAHAQMLLHVSNLPLAEVALACGFAQQSSFTTAFRRETGCTPANWRRYSQSADSPDRTH